jgi:AraC-like DNA-binding protein
MNHFQILSTESLSLVERWRSYQRALCQCFGPNLELQPDKSSEFTCHFEQAPIPEIGMYDITATRHRVERMKNAGRLEEGHFVKVVLQVGGFATYEQDGRTLTMGPGEWSLYDMSRPYLADFHGPFEILLLVVPYGKIYSKQFDLKDLVLQRCSSATEGLSGLTYQFIRNTFNNAPALNRQSKSDVIDMLSNLIRLTMIDCSGGLIVSPPTEILCERIKTYISANLRDPALSVSRIANALKCTPRYLQKAFEKQKQEMSISAYIWQLRLERCHKDLLDPTFRNRSITDIAFSWGFNSSSHFCTTFKEHFGASPNLFRRNALLDHNWA